MKTVLPLMAGTAALVCSGVAVLAGTTTACDPLDQRVHAIRVAVGGNVSPSDEYTPTVIAPHPDGTAVLA